MKTPKSTIESYSYEDNGTTLSFSFVVGPENRRQKLAFVKMLRDVADLLDPELRNDQ